MRILQLIDSLETGGAERMAVNYANAIYRRNGFSALAVTRKEGGLLHEKLPQVEYIFLKKKSVFDLKAIFRLYSFVAKNKITIIHAHSTSFFTAVLLKLLSPKLKLIWHDHYGKSEFLEERKSAVLTICSFFFKGIIAVNQLLLHWAVAKLLCKNVVYMPNFTVSEQNSGLEKELQGEPGKRIVCLANLRAQKNHEMLFAVAKKLNLSCPGWSFHLVGNDFNDAYSQFLRQQVIHLGLEENVFFYGSRNDVHAILKSCQIGILTSSSEGLPVALLEYGFAELPVVVTAVGEIPNVIIHEKNGLLLQPNDVAGFCQALETIIKDVTLSRKLAQDFHQTIMEKYHENAVIEHYLNWLNTIVIAK